MALESHSSKIYDIQIGGYSLRLKANQGTEKVEQLIQAVEERVQESLKNNKNISMQKALILSCLNLAEDHFALKEQTLQEINQLESKLQSISALLKSEQKV